MAADPIHQFQISKIIDFAGEPAPDRKDGPRLHQFAHGHDHRFRDDHRLHGARDLQHAVVPGRLQAAGENLFVLIDDLAESIIGPEGKTLFPFVFTVFSFILAMNILGLLLTFSVTSQLAITRHLRRTDYGAGADHRLRSPRLGFFKLFVRPACPSVLLPVIILIEFVSFCCGPSPWRFVCSAYAGRARRLAGVAGFVVALGALAAGAGSAFSAFPVRRCRSPW